MRRNITVTVADSHLAGIDELAAQLRDAGMEVDGVLAAIGVVTGSVDSERLAAIAALPGVAALEVERTVHLPPPDAGVQ